MGEARVNLRTLEVWDIMVAVGESSEPLMVAVWRMGVMGRAPGPHDNMGTCQ